MQIIAFATILLSKCGGCVSFKQGFPRRTKIIAGGGLLFLFLGCKDKMVSWMARNQPRRRRCLYPGRNVLKVGEGDLMIGVAAFEISVYPQEGDVILPLLVSFAIPGVY